MNNTTLQSKSKLALTKLSRLNILLAEDNLLNIKLITVLFAQYGVPIQAVVNGMEAVEKIKTNNFDLVLMDMEMPVMNGYDATAIIRNELKSNIPIIALTAHAGIGEMEKCLLLGMNGYISKPIDAVALFNSIYKVTGEMPSAKSTIYSAGTAIVAPGKICNMDYLMGATRGNEKIINSIVSVFFKETKKELVCLNAAIKNTNYPVIRDISHKIRSAFSILGISVLEPVFKEMEQLSSNTASTTNINLLNKKVNLVFKQAMIEMKF